MAWLVWSRLIWSRHGAAWPGTAQAGDRRASGTHSGSSPERPREARRSRARLGWGRARPGEAWDRAGDWQPPGFEAPAPTARQGSVRLGVVWQGLARHRGAWRGLGFTPQCAIMPSAQVQCDHRPPRTAGRPSSCQAMTTS